MTDPLNILRDADVELLRIEQEAEARRQALKVEIALATAQRRAEVGAIVEMVGALILPDDVIGGALIVIAERFRVDPQAVQKYQDEFAARFPGAAKKKRGRRPRAPAQGDGAGAQVGEAVASTAAGQKTAAE